MALSKAQIRAIAIRRSVAKRSQIAANDNVGSTNLNTMSPKLLAECVATGGFDQNARFA